MGIEVRARSGLTGPGRWPLEAQNHKNPLKTWSRTRILKSQCENVTLAGVSSMVLGHQVAKVCSGQRFGDPKVEYGPRARPGQAGRPWICPFWDLPGQVFFFCPVRTGQKTLNYNRIIFWNLEAGWPAAQGRPGPARPQVFSFARSGKVFLFARAKKSSFKCFLIPGRY